MKPNKENWKVINRKQTVVSRFTIITDEVELPNRDKLDFSYIHFQQGVCILPLTNDGKVIVLEQYRHAFKSWEYELPAGMVEHGEEPIEAAKRELLEETGVKAKSWKSLGYLYPSPGSTSEVIHLFVATDLINTNHQHLDRSENIKVQYMDFQKLLKLIEMNKFHHGGGLAVILKYWILLGGNFDETFK
ncbi:NUDIX hydrolase [Parageobacillus thermoglucosidasius]|uniref:NUDIX hydrolase n=1 Tax=Parageobacillus thermoglucosidasius TaxID=1426 RepID=UPI000B54E297|nr:NUDIX hydrolase [Parageobacillus thermoglucosidasius]OUM90024.1 MAG: NUDIX hydrolase [Parageobacillus thermoglucosidasius]